MAVKRALFVILISMGTFAQTGCTAGDTLQSLSQAGVVSQPQTVTIVINGYRAQAGATFQNLFVSNFSAKVSQGQLLPSTARDSMTDSLKTNLNGDYGFSIAQPESVITGFADLLLYNLGIKTPQQNLLHCSSGQMISTTNDGIIYNDDRLAGSPSTFLGLRDCEKIYMGLNPSLFDNAGNGIPDYLKLRCGISPTNPAEAYLSAAGDGVANIDKCKQNIPLSESANTPANKIFAYKYATSLQNDGTTQFTISNIPILNGGAENLIVFYITETGVTSSTTGLYTAYALLKSGYSGKTLNVSYWATSSSTTFFNQAIQVP